MAKRFFFGIFLLALSLAAFRSAQAQKLYMFTGGDFEDEKAGSAIWMGDEQVDGAIAQNMPAKYFVRYNERSAYDGGTGDEWTGPDIHHSDNVHDDILEAIERCPAGEKDAIFFYWCGHGAYDDDGHYLFMPKGRGRPTMYRKEILNALHRKNPRLVVFITDSCHTYLPPCAMSWVPGMPSPRFLETEAGIPRLYVTLFFTYSGTLDMNSSSPDQKSDIMDPTKYQGSGTVFSCAFSSIMENKRLQPYGWKELVQQINAMARGWNFNQDCHVWTYPEKINSNPIPESEIARRGWWRTISGPGGGWDGGTGGWGGGTGGWGGGTGGWGGGTGGWDGSSGDWSAPIYHPEVGDRIVGVNGVPVADVSEFSRAVKSSPTVITLRVYESRKGSYCYLRTSLRPSGSRSRLGIVVDDDGGPGALVIGVRGWMPGYYCEYRREDGGGWPGGTGGGGGVSDGPDGDWSAPTYRPEVGDRIIEVNGKPVNSEAEYRRAVADSPPTITLTIIEYRNGKRAYLKTDLLPHGYKTRLGINAVTSRQGGVVVNIVVQGTPGTRCRYKAE